MDQGLFAEVGELLRSMAPEGLGEVRFRSHRRGIKVWIGPQKPTREHYEAQFIAGRHLNPPQPDDAMLIEVGFHAENPDEAANEASLQKIVKKQHVWSKELAGDVESGPFLGRSSWRRLSEVWADADPEDPELAFELASRLVDYLEIIEPIRQG